MPTPLSRAASHAGDAPRLHCYEPDRWSRGRGVLRHVLVVTLMTAFVIAFPDRNLTLDVANASGTTVGTGNCETTVGSAAGATVATTD
ncbi:MAG: hypothetical protein ACO31V_06765, partial [Ilumatobacteraceae bacterium]